MQLCSSIVAKSCLACRPRLGYFASVAATSSIETGVKVTFARAQGDLQGFVTGAGTNWLELPKGLASLWEMRNPAVAVWSKLEVEIPVCRQ